MSAHHRHASAFVKSSSIASQFGFGALGLLCVHGGTTDKLGNNPASLLSDTWLFDLETRIWTPLQNFGQAPGARQGHAMAVSGTQVRLDMY